MTHQWTRINLASAEFPFESDFWGRSILLPQYDTNFDYITQMKEPELNRGLPQAFYMHNVVPTTQGYQAIGYEQILSGLANVTDFDQVFPLEYTTPLVAKFLFAPAFGKNYVYDADIGVWEAMSVMGNIASSPVATAQLTQMLAIASTYVDESVTLPNGTTVSQLGAFWNYANAVEVLGSVANTTFNSSAYTYIENEFQVPNGGIVSSVNVYSTVAFTGGIAYIVLWNSAASVTVVAQTAVFNHLGQGWQTVPLSANYTVPNTGTYYAAVFTPATTGLNTVVTTDTAQYYAGTISGTVAVGTYTGAHPVLQVSYTLNQIEIFIVKQNMSGSYTVEATTGLVTHNGNGWQDFAISGGNYTIPSTGTYMLAAWLPGSAYWNYNSNISYAYINGIATGTQTWTEVAASTTSVCPAMRASNSTSFAASVPQNAFVTTAFVNGKTYIYYQNIGCLYYDQVNKVMQSVTLSGLTNSDIKGITSANGYLIAWDDTTVAWSNVTNPEDLYPSLTTGAGGGPVQYCNGKIMFCLAISGGFLIYCEKNIVSASYTANVRYPYIFSEVAGSGGCQSPSEVTWQGNLSYHYAWTTAGIQQLNKSSSELLFGSATDFLANLTFEDFDESSLTIALTYLSSPLNTRLSIVMERYVIISYGMNYPNFTHALIYDLALKRWGKLKINHRACFEWNAPSIYGQVEYGELLNISYGQLANTTYGQLANKGVNLTEVAKKNIAFLQKDGTIQIVDFDLVGTVADGVLILGKFQFERNKFVIHNRTDVESVLNGNTFDAYILNSINGKDMLAAAKMVTLLEGQMIRKFAKRTTGQNFSLLFVGAFNLTSVLIDVSMAGER